MNAVLNIGLRCSFGIVQKGYIKQYSKLVLIFHLNLMSDSLGINEIIVLKTVLKIFAIKSKLRMERGTITH